MDADKFKDYSMGDLRKKTRSELMYLLHRQDAILAKAYLIAKLSDKGEKIRNLKAAIEKAIITHDQMDHTAQQLALLQLHSRDNGAGNSKSTDEFPENIEKDDDIYTTLATRDIVVKHTREKVSTLTSPESEQTKDGDVKEHSEGTQTLKSEDMTATRYKLVEEMQEKPKGRERFRPNRNATPSTKDNSERSTKPFSDSAVDPPPSRFEATQLISLQESYNLQHEQMKKLKESQIQHALNHLRIANTTGRPLTSENEPILEGPAFTRYREFQSPDQSDEDDD